MAEAMQRALTGLRVVECGGMVSAAYAAKLMADLGAHVIKVEPPEGDPSRRRGPFPTRNAEFGMRNEDGASDSAFRTPHSAPELGGLFLYLNANKRGVTLNLHDPEGRAILLRLVAEADVLIHNVSPPLCDALELSYERIAAGAPGLIVTQITPFGAFGPHRDYAGHELTEVAAGGWAFISPGGQTDPDKPPLKAFGHQADFQAAAHAAVATMGALFARRRTGRGQHVDISAQECIAAALELALPYYTYAGVVASRLGARTSAPMEMMRCKDGYVFIMCVEEHQWQAFVEMMGSPEWATWDVFKDRGIRAENRDVLRRYIEEWLMQRTADEIFRMAGEAHLPFAPVSTVGDLLRSEQLRVRGFFAELTHPAAGTLTFPGAPYKLPVTPWQLRMPAPLLGQHNAEAYGNIGLEPGELARLHRVGVI